MYRPQFIDIEWPQSITRLQGEQPQNSAFDFCGFIAVIDHIAYTTMYKTAKIFLINFIKELI
jgi:hypothetical protein